MRKSECVDLLARRLGCRAGRLTSMTQRATEAGLLRANISKRPHFDITTDELGRMVLLGVVDEGLSQAAGVVQRYGQQLRCAALNSTLEACLGFSLTRPERLPPAHAGLTIRAGDAPSAVLTVATPDGVHSYEFVGTATGLPSGIERTISVSGAALFAVAKEFGGATAVEVDALLKEGA